MRTVKHRQMNEIESHPFSLFIPENATALILGSFPGREQTQTECDNDQWFYGAKRNQFWKIISSVYNTDLLCKEDKQQIFQKFGIGITDILLKVRRKIITIWMVILKLSNTMTKLSKQFSKIIILNQSFSQANM